MIDLIDEGRALLALADAAHEPSEADRVRVRAALAARLGAAAGLGMAAGLGASAAKAAVAAAGAGAFTGAGATTAGTVAVGGTLAAKLIGAIVLAATVGGSVAAIHGARRPVAATHEATAKPTRATSATRHASPVVAEPLPSSQSLRDPDEETPPATPRAMTEVPQTRAQSPAQHSVATRAPAEVARPLGAQRVPEVPAMPSAGAAKAPREVARALPPLAQRSMPTVDGEARLVGDGVAALRAGEPARALEMFDAHARRYPCGVLSEERDFERVLALAALGRQAQARSAADEFVGAHPTSPLATRLRRSILVAH